RSRLLSERRGGPLHVRRPYCAGRRSAGQHQWRRPLLLPSRHVWIVPVDRGGTAAAARMRRPSDRRLRDRNRAWQWRGAVVTELGDPRNTGNDLTGLSPSPASSGFGPIKDKRLRLRKNIRLFERTT